MVALVISILGVLMCILLNVIGIVQNIVPISEGFGEVLMNFFRTLLTDYYLEGALCFLIIAVLSFLLWFKCYKN